MFLVNSLSSEEQQVIKRVDNYFKSSSMTLQDKLFNAILIAQHELEEHNFSSETERIKITRFKNILECLCQKINS